jgi:hypothetical protein
MSRRICATVVEIEAEAPRLPFLRGFFLGAGATGYVARERTRFAFLALGAARRLGAFFAARGLLRFFLPPAVVRPEALPLAAFRAAL